MSTQSNGGPAFPRAPFDYTEVGSGLDFSVAEQCGMSLRDWFAGQALTGICADPTYNSSSLANFATVAYEMADAMLEVRNQ